MQLIIPSYDNSTADDFEHILSKNRIFCYYVFKKPSAAEVSESVYMRERAIYQVNVFVLPGLKEGIKNLEKMIVKAKGFKMVIDWRMAYDELQRITQMMKIGFMKKKPKAVKKGKMTKCSRLTKLIIKKCYLLTLSFEDCIL